MSSTTKLYYRNKCNELCRLLSPIKCKIDFVLKKVALHFIDYNISLNMVNIRSQLGSRCK